MKKGRKMIISSKENTKIKEIIKLRNNTDKSNPWIFIEGEKICREAFISGVEIKLLILSENKYSIFDNEIKDASSEVIVVRDNVFSLLSYTANPQGVIAIVKSKIIPEDDFVKKPELIINEKYKLLICENIQDPGNFGSIIRNADAFGFDGVIFTKGNVHPFNNKALQSSMGSVFHIDLIYTENLISLIANLKEMEFKIYATHLNGVKIDSRFSFINKFAVILGNEGNGISEEISSASDELIRIPMSGKAESLNVANAAAIICFLTNQKSDTI